MNRHILKSLLATTVLAMSSSAFAGQAPGAASAPDIPISHHDRVYAADRPGNLTVGPAKVGPPTLQTREGRQHG